MSYQTFTNNYKNNAILTASPEKLVVMMYEGAIKNMEMARLELEKPDNDYAPRIGETLGKAMAIIGELRAVLDFEKGAPVAQELDRLYEFCLDRIYQTNLNRRPEDIRGPIRVMKTLKEGWDALVPA